MSRKIISERPSYVLEDHNKIPTQGSHSFFVLSPRLRLSKRRYSQLAWRYSHRANPSCARWRLPLSRGKPGLRSRRPLQLRWSPSPSRSSTRCTCSRCGAYASLEPCLCALDWRNESKLPRSAFLGGTSTTPHHLWRTKEIEEVQETTRKHWNSMRLFLV